MTIIQHIATQFVEKILNSLKKDGLSDIGKTINSFLPIVSQTVLEIIQAVLKEMDDSLCTGAKSLRKQDGITIKERNISRTVLTELGELTYQRTYFKGSDGSFAYLLDHLIGVEEYERMSKQFVATLLNAASVNSYQKAIDLTKQDVSRQTVHNRMLAMKNLAVDVQRVKETPETLDLFADEDHVHLNPRRSAIVPLVTITEGMDESNPGRHRTINPLHVAAYGMSQDAFQANVLAVLNQRYDLPRVKKINLHADGGKWIAALQDQLPRCCLVMDGYHLEKYLRPFLRLEGASHYAKVVRDALKDQKGYAKFESICKKIEQLQSTEAEKNKVHVFQSYCKTHWDSIVVRMNKQTCGSCTESQVSHVLSEGLSRNPIAWSRKGLSKMTMLVVYTKNGCKVAADDVRVHTTDQADSDFRNQGYTKYAMYAKQQADELMEAFRNTDFFEPERFSFSKVDPAYIIRKSMGRLASLSDIIA